MSSQPPDPSPLPAVALRPFRGGDAAALVKHADNRKVSIHLRDRFPHPYTPQDALNWISIATQGNPLTNFAIVLRNGEAGGDELIGGIGLILGEDVFRLSAELGYWLGEAHWGKGHASEAVRQMCAHAFKTLPIVRIFAGVFETNPASARVLEKAEFRLESRQSKAIFKEGRILDQLIYVQTRPAGR